MRFSAVDVDIEVLNAVDVDSEVLCCGCRH